MQTKKTDHTSSVARFTERSEALDAPRPGSLRHQSKMRNKKAKSPLLAQTDERLTEKEVEAPVIDAFLTSPTKKPRAAQSVDAFSPPRTPTCTPCGTREKTTKKKDKKKDKKKLKNKKKVSSNYKIISSPMTPRQLTSVAADETHGEDARRLVERTKRTTPGRWPDRQLMEDWSVVFASLGTAAPLEILENVRLFLGDSKVRETSKKERAAYRVEFDATSNKRMGKFGHCALEGLSWDGMGSRDKLLAVITEAIAYKVETGTGSFHQKMRFATRKWLPFCLLQGISPINPGENEVMSFLLWLLTNGTVSSIKKEVTKILDDESRVRYVDRVKSAMEGIGSITDETLNPEEVDIKLRSLGTLDTSLKPNTVKQYWSGFASWLGEVARDPERPNPAESPRVKHVLNWVARHSISTNPNASSAKETVPPPPSAFSDVLMNALAMVAVAEAWNFKLNPDNFFQDGIIPTKAQDVFLDGSPLNAQFVRELRDSTMFLIATYFALRGGEAGSLTKQNLVIVEDAARLRHDVATRPGGAGHGLPPQAQIRLTLNLDKVRTATQNADDQRVLPASPMTTRIASILHAWYAVRESYRRAGNFWDTARIFDTPGLDKDREYPRDWVKNGAMRLTKAVKNLMAKHSVTPKVVGTKFTGHGCRKAGATLLHEAKVMNPDELRKWGGWSYRSLIAGSTYIRGDSLAPDGSRAKPLCRFLMSGHQTDMIPSSEHAAEQQVYEREHFYLFDEFLDNYKLPYEFTEDRLGYYVSKGWYQLYGSDTIESVLSSGRMRAPIPASALQNDELYNTVSDDDDDDDEVIFVREIVSPKSVERTIKHDIKKEI